MEINYDELYKNLKRYLLEKNPQETKDKTQTIKWFFYDEYSKDYQVLFSREGNSEYMTDLMITSFQPKDLFEKDKKFSIMPESIKAHLAVESELGGVSASWAGGLMKNVAEDFCKLLLIQSTYKVMVFSSLPYADEKNNKHIENRVKTLAKLYEMSAQPSSREEILLVHLFGIKETNKQVQTSISNKDVAGFLIDVNGHYKQIDDE